MKLMNRPDTVNVTCPHCGYNWEQPTESLRAQEIVIYRGDKTVKRRIACPNCHKWATVSVPAEWFDHE
jgi:DNA-directed RNA polymerase subunit M/transcription elongation factor TFIIS